MRKMLRRVVFGVVMVVSGVCVAQQPMKSAGASVALSAMRYFKLTMVLKYPTNGELEPMSQSITTEVAVYGDGRIGSCRTRMTSQVPVGTGVATKFIDVGTKFDCNDVRLEGDGLAMSIVLETSRLTRMISIKNRDGVETVEPVISQRNVTLSVKLPLNTPKVVFDSKDVDSSKLKPLGSLGATAAKDGSMMQDAAMQIEMTASELK
ncbi:hypothetical protein [Granulicella arctica]|uniref:Lipid/polyisoprenoid-binding YceI-like domain-containing protein n=1 Tax=Granulicella arctica TaxID=940613 RepID=A0A7Y9TJK2_9BACT|nr:hypothetical protein [Granulicella arctica]NYF78357.1 hypothetical protein [Granulicella arctica]